MAMKRPVLGLCGVSAATLLSVFYASPTSAQISISGGPNKIVLRSENDSVKQILITIADRFRVTISASTKLDRTIVGSYEGSLRDVIRRVLAGYDFVIISQGEQIVVKVVGTQLPSKPETATAPTVPSASRAPQPYMPELVFRD
jgi:hypothetical protein